MAVKKSISTIGDLRKAIEGLSDDRQIFFQVAGEDGTAWLLGADFYAEPKYFVGRSVLTLTHPNLKTLPTF